MKDIPMIPIVYPQNRTSPASVDYLISEFETVLTILYTITGNMVSEKSMEEAIAVYNQHNATMREFDTAANDHLDVITPKVRHVVHKSAFFFEKGDSRIYRFTPGDLKEIERLKAEKYTCGEWIYDKAVSVSV